MCLTVHKLIMGYLMPKFESFVTDGEEERIAEERERREFGLVWSGLVSLTTYQLIVGYLMLKFDSLINFWL